LQPKAKLDHAKEKCRPDGHRERHWKLQKEHNKNLLIYVAEGKGIAPRHDPAGIAPRQRTRIRVGRRGHD